MDSLLRLEKAMLCFVKRLCIVDTVVVRLVILAPTLLDSIHSSQGLSTRDSAALGGALVRSDRMRSVVSTLSLVC